MTAGDEMSRVSSAHRQTAATYDRISGWYDLLAGSEQRAARLGMKMLAVQHRERILEIGCGSGHALDELASAAGDVGVVCGVDVSPRMLALSRSRTRMPACHVWRVCADATLLPCASRTFDAAFMSFVRLEARRAAALA